MKRIKVAVISGGPSAEHEVSLNSAKNVLKNIDNSKFEILNIKISKENIWIDESKDDSFSEDEGLKYLKEEKVDLVFIILHGEYGEDGTLQNKLEEHGIKFTGSGSAASKLAMDKVKSSNVLNETGLVVPSFISLNKIDWDTEKDQLLKSALNAYGLPIVIKPTDRGSSVGTTIVYKEEELEKAILKAFDFSHNVMVQEYINGKELTCAVLEGRDGEDIPLIPTEIVPNNDNLFFDYDAKYKPGASLEITPPNLPESVIEEIQEQAVKAHATLGCTGISRSDFILKDDVLYILEVNTIPGLTETSLLPQGAKALGIEFSVLIEIIIEAALR